MRAGAEIELVGKVSAITDDGSPILLGSRGRLDQLPFEVCGRLQVSYARGSWNEWFLTFADGNVGWLADAQGSFSIVRPRHVSVTAGRVPPFGHIAVGMEIPIDGVPAIVVDRRGAAYQGAEGILPFRAQPGLTFWGVDLRGYAGECFTLDYGNDPEHAQPVPYVGRAVDLQAIQLHPLRRFEGWP